MYWKFDFFEKEFRFQMKIVNYITAIGEWRGKRWFSCCFSSSLLSVYVIIMLKEVDDHHNKIFSLTDLLCFVYNMVKCGINFWQIKLYVEAM